MTGHPAIEPDWKWGTPEGSRELDRILDRRLSFREKLQWLEEAETLTLRLQAQRGKAEGEHRSCGGGTGQPVRDGQPEG